MWSSVLLTDRDVAGATVFSSVVVIPAGDPIALIDAIAQQASMHVVVAAPSALAGDLAVSVNLATGRFPDVRVATLVSGHAPLAMLSCLVLARQVTEQPALGHRLAEALLAASWSGAWLHSLARLAAPAPTMAQHLRSLLPGAGFLIRQHPEPAVLGQPRTDDVPRLEVDRALLVQDDAVPAPVVRRISEQPRVATVRQVTVPGTWKAVYGAGAGQLALVPAQPAERFGTPSHTCSSCGLAQLEPICPFCRTIVAPRPVQTAGSPG